MMSIHLTCEWVPCIYFFLVYFRSSACLCVVCRRTNVAWSDIDGQTYCCCLCVASHWNLPLSRRIVCCLTSIFLWTWCWEHYFATYLLLTFMLCINPVLIYVYAAWSLHLVTDVFISFICSPFVWQWCRCAFIISLSTKFHMKVRN